EVSSAASTRPSASATGIVSPASGLTAPSTIWRACSMVINSRATEEIVASGASGSARRLCERPDRLGFLHPQCGPGCHRQVPTGVIGVWAAIDHRHDERPAVVIERDGGSTGQLAGGDAERRAGELLAAG